MKTFIICIIAALLVLLFGRIKSKTKKLHIKFLLDIVRALIIITVLTILGLNLSGETNVWSVIIKNGTLLVAIVTFVAQKTLGNIIAGISLSISKPFEIGDKIKATDGNSIIAEGIVKNITLRHSVIQTFDEQTVLIPNAILDNATIINTTYTTDVGRFFEVQIGYNDDFEQAIRIIQDVCNEEPLVKKATAPLLSGYGNSGITIKNTIFTDSVDDNFVACSNIRKRLLQEFKANNISIPYQTITINKG